MAERDLLNAFDDCIDRLQTGETLESCLRAYPQFASELQPMLRTGQAMQRVRIDPAEVQAAQLRARARVIDTLQPPTLSLARPTRPLLRWFATAAALILILGVFVGGTALAAESSLPGDPLYGYKRLTEAVRLTLPGDHETLREQFAQRRIDEIRQLEAINRAESVDFSGVVEVMDGENWQVAGLPLGVPADLPGIAGIRLRDVVAVQARTLPDSRLIAERITLIAPSDEPTPTPSLVPTQPPTLTVTAMPAMTETPTPSPTQTVTPAPTHTPTVTPAIPETPLPDANTDCVATAPDGWVTYTIRSGDTLSHLATQTGISLEELRQVNCLTDARLIVAGQTIYLPYIPVATQASPGSDNQSGQSGSSSQNGNGSGNSGSSGNSGQGGSSSGGSDDSGHDDDGDDDHGGSDSSNSGSGSDDDHSGKGSGSSDDD